MPVEGRTLIYNTPTWEDILWGAVVDDVKIGSRALISDPWEIIPDYTEMIVGHEANHVYRFTQTTPISRLESETSAMMSSLNIITEGYQRNPSNEVLLRQALVAYYHTRNLVNVLKNNKISNYAESITDLNTIAARLPAQYVEYL
jgi:hypothetical protein